MSYLHIQGHKGHQAVILNDFCYLLVQQFELLEERVGGQVI